MIKEISNGLIDLFQTGVRRNTGEALRNRIRLSNQLSILLLPFAGAVLAWIASRSSPSNFYGALFLLPFVLCPLTVWLNKIEKNVLARCVLCLNFALMAWSARLLVGHDGAGHFIFHPIIAGLPLLMFLDNESIPAVSSSIIGFSADVVSQINSPALPADYLTKMGFNINYGEFVAIIIVCVLLVHITRRSAKLRETVRRLIDLQSEKLSYQSKLVEYGRAIGSVCHALSGPLSIIIGKAGNMKSALQSDPINGSAYAVQASGQIEDAAIDLSEIVEACELLAKDTGDGYGTVSVRNVFYSLEKLFRDSCNKSGVQLQFQVHEEAMVVDCSYHDLSQVLITLINNAKDSVSGLQIKWIKVEARTKDASIEFLVTDSRATTKCTLASRIIEQFFSNDAPGRKISTGIQDAELIVLERSGSFRRNCGPDNSQYAFTLKAAEPFEELGSLIAKWAS